METPLHGRHSRTRHHSLDHAKDRTLRLLKQLPPGVPETVSQVPPSATGRSNKGGLAVLNPATVLRELFELLEGYAPVWYTEENHNRALAALARTRQ